MLNIEKIYAILHNSKLQYIENSSKTLGKHCLNSRSRKWTTVACEKA